MKRKLLTIFVVPLGLVAGVTIAIWLFASEEWDGWGAWTFRVTVLEAGSRQPISTATSRIVVANETSFGKIESFIEPDTTSVSANGMGVCLITSRFPCYGHKSRFKSTAFMNFRHRNLRVELQDIECLNVRLKPLLPYRLSLNRFLHNKRRGGAFSFGVTSLPTSIIETSLPFVL